MNILLFRSVIFWKRLIIRLYINYCIFLLQIRSNRAVFFDFLFPRRSLNWRFQSSCRHFQKSGFLTFTQRQNLHRWWLKPPSSPLSWHRSPPLSLTGSFAILNKILKYHLLTAWFLCDTIYLYTTESKLITKNHTGTKN